jgi:hypothetical protein
MLKRKSNYPRVLHPYHSIVLRIFLCGYLTTRKNDSCIIDSTKL